MLTRRVLLLAAFGATLTLAAPKEPKLVVFIVVDQCRYDYLTRYRGDLTGGFDLLLKHGANFSNANADFFPTLTATSHATLLTGAMPSATGIVGNEWFDRKSGNHVTSVSDDLVQPVGTTQSPGLSPRNLLVPTLGDQLKKNHPGSRVIGIAIKDRSAMLLAGQHPDAAVWFDDWTGRYVTSTWYGSTLPSWVREYNDASPADRYLDARWAGHQIAPAPDGYKAMHRTPFGDELTEMLAEKAIEAERLGKGPDPDLLALSFASLDYAGHDYGPDTAEWRDALHAMDRTLGRLFTSIDKQVGLASTLIVLTSDHGVPPPPEVKGGRSPLTDVSDWVQAALSKKYGPGNWVAGCWDLLLYLDENLIAEKKLNRANVNRAAAEALLTMPHIARAYTREQLMDLKMKGDTTLRRMRDGFHPERGADIEFLPEPFWVFTNLRTTHGSTYSYDIHVPLIFMGPGIAPGTHAAPTRSNDIAPTLAKILNIPAPPASVGHVIDELY